MIQCITKLNNNRSKTNLTIKTWIDKENEMIKWMIDALTTFKVLSVYVIIVMYLFVSA